MKVKTRIMSAAVACLMLVSLLPTTVFAADDVEHTTHDYSVWVSTLDPGNCQDGTPGIAKYKCSGCTKTSYKAIDAEHTKGTVVETVAADCGNDGYTTYKCSVCGDEFDEVIPATGLHTETEGIIAATCTEPQKVGTKCSVCGIQLGEAEEVEGSEPLGHNFVMTVITQPDCKNNAPGSQQLKCTRCGETSGDVESIAAEHDWVEDEEVGQEDL